MRCLQLERRFNVLSGLEIESPETIDDAVQLTAGEGLTFRIKYSLKSSTAIVFHVSEISWAGQSGYCTLRVLLGEHRLAEIDISNSGTFRLNGLVNWGLNDTLTISLVEPLGFTAGLSRIVISDIQTEPSGVHGLASYSTLRTHQLSDWIPLAKPISPLLQTIFLSSKDPSGITVEDVDTFTKFIRNTWAETVKRLQITGLLERHALRDLVAETRIWSTRHPKFSMAISVDKGWSCSESTLSYSQLKDVALKWLRLDQALMKESPPLFLIDFGAVNFASFGNDSLRLIDLGSIQFAGKHFEMRSGIDALIMRGLPLLKLLSEHAEDISEIVQLWFAGSEVDQGISINAPIGKLLAWLGIDEFNLEDVDSRQELGARIEQWINSLPTIERPDYWCDATKSIYGKSPMTYLVPNGADVPGLTSEKSQTRVNTIESLIKTFDAKRLIDLGCNTGQFSIMSSMLGHSVLAIDSSHECIEKLSSSVRAFPELRLTTRYRDIRRWIRDRRTLRLPDDPQAEVVLCLALSHHLLLSNPATRFDKPVDLEELTVFLSEICSHHLLFEFMPLGFGAPVFGGYPVPAELPDWYHIETVVDYLSAEFDQVNLLTYEDTVHGHRQLIVCEKQTPNPRSS